MTTIDLSERQLDLDGSAGGLFRFLIDVTDSGGPVNPTGWTTVTHIYWRDGTLAAVPAFTTFWTGNVLTVEMSAANTAALFATGHNFRWVLLVNDIPWLGGAFTLSHLGFDPAAGCGTSGGSASMVFTGIAATPNNVVRSLTVTWLEAITQLTYDAIPIPDPQTVYIIVP